MALPESPWRHWRSYGTDPLPAPAEALQQPMRAFPSWFLKITCDRCFKDTVFEEARMSDRQRGIVLVLLIAIQASAWPPRVRAFPLVVPSKKR